MEASSANRLAERSQALRNALARFFQRQLPGAIDIEDLVQEVFLRIVRRGASDELEHFEGYVFETAASVLKDRTRRRRARAADRHVLFDPEVHSRDDMGPEREIIGRESLNQMTELILALPERTRTIFVLRRLEGLQHREIASRLGLSVSAVEKHIQRAAKHILTHGADR